ncbi:hypothetical protein LSH36_790g01072 [Paralvinella palmiformis]|uniref:Glycosyl transferase family 25 domain-containing protein n=1 Tax=Paralvinella palmiformis TaxID=53620 RepID=A0AAD9IZW7_9ANNE|nr:hypothetical protein LSH36_790g01072 [Paralvinella palmiformis]
MVKKNYGKVMVLEDDIRFEMFFKQNLQQLLDEVETSKIKWDLIYLGRKRLKISLESYLEGVNRLVWPHYSYWTLGYVLSLSGAQKLLAQRPLGKMLPVDEYLPVMFDKHPKEQWLNHFSPRDLVALSAQPLLLYPTHYTGEPGYFTDTEDSEVVSIWNEHGAPESRQPDTMLGDTEHGMISDQGAGLLRSDVKADATMFRNDEL